MTQSLCGSPLREQPPETQTLDKIPTPRACSCDDQTFRSSKLRIYCLRKSIGRWRYGISYLSTPPQCAASGQCEGLLILTWCFSWNKLPQFLTPSFPADFLVYPLMEVFRWPQCWGKHHWLPPIWLLRHFWMLSYTSTVFLHVLLPVSSSLSH